MRLKEAVEAITELEPAPTGRGTPCNVKMSYTHEAMIDLIIAKPYITLAEVAETFGYTKIWCSRLMRSDAFRELLAARKKELMDPVLLQSIESRLNSLATRAIDVIEDKLEANPSADVALKALDLATRGLGLGAAKQPQVAVSFVVAMPPKEASGGEWVAAHSPRPPIDVTPAADG